MGRLLMLLTLLQGCACQVSITPLFDDGERPAVDGLQLNINCTET